MGRPPTRPQVPLFLMHDPLGPSDATSCRIDDLAPLGSAARLEQRFGSRYLPSQQHYFDAIRPTDLADIVVHNDEPERPAWDVRPH